MELKSAFRVVPGVSWGRMESSEEHKHSWTSLRCDCYFDRACKDKVFKTRPPALHSTTTAAGAWRPRCRSGGVAPCLTCALLRAATGGRRWLRRRGAGGR